MVTEKLFSHLISVLKRYFCGGRSLVLWQKVHYCCKSRVNASLLPLIYAVVKEILALFSVYIACLILGFLDYIVHTATVVVALPCPLDFVLLNMSSHKFGSSHDDGYVRISWVLLLGSGLVSSSLLKSSLRIFIYYLFSELFNLLHFRY